MSKKNISPKEARSETEIFEELDRLCCSPGFIHAVAYFCWRDNLIRFSGEQVTEEDVQHQYSDKKLLRTEISTLVGLMAKGDIDLGVPKPSTLQNYLDQAEALLHEMHMSLQKPWMAAFEVMARNPSEANSIDPFSTADGLREPRAGSVCLNSLRPFCKWISALIMPPSGLMAAR